MRRAAAGPREEMGDELVALILDESKWLTASMSCALVALALQVHLHRRSKLAPRRRLMAAMCLFTGATIATMAFGHLLAVTVKLALGILVGSAAAVYAIGIALALPSAGLARHSFALLDAGRDPGRRTLALNAWLALTLLALGVHNLPLAVPAVLNIGYDQHRRSWVGWAVVAAAVVVNLGLFAGSLVFLASGRSFEEFRGLE
ncbi:MAG TPA: hypothetical protein VFM88_14425 [Vicinamibacteria bacterium]|nr:hypothetical protein [Vicinamibacteria bacterium]